MKKISIIILLALAVTAGCGHTDLTFVAISDLHIGKTSGTTAANYTMVDYLNNLPGKTYPSSVGGKVGSIRGVVIPGDLTESPWEPNWKILNEIYSPTGNGKVKFPVYEGLGNHDISSGTTYPHNQIRARTKERPNIVMTDPTGLHYSWDWGNVHLVQLNLYVGETGLIHKYDDPMRSYSFLKEDLAKNVGKSGRPVIVMNHYAWPEPGKGSIADSKKAAALLKQYNCIAIIHGHKHALKHYTYEGLDVFNDGSVAYGGGMLVFHITDGKMVVVSRKNDAWGSIFFKKDIKMGTPRETLVYKGGHR